MRAKSLKVIGAAGGGLPPGEKDRVLPLLDDPVWFVRLQAAKALGILRHGKAVPLLAKRLVDDNWQVRNAAATAVVLTSDNAIGIFLDTLGATDRYAKESVCEEIQKTDFVYRSDRQPRFPGPGDVREIQGDPEDHGGPGVRDASSGVSEERRRREDPEGTDAHRAGGGGVMRSFAVSLVMGVNYFILFYYGFVNLIYTILLLVSMVVILRHIRRIRYSPFKDFVTSPETPPVSILVSAYNEERVIVRTVRSTLAVNYPFFEVIVINDGSTDATLDTLVRTFHLRKVDRAYRNVLKTTPVRGFYYNPDVPNLLVVDKENSGKADSLNCGINVSRSPYFCTVDADSVLEENALIKLMTPTVESTVPVIACGGVIRALNGVHMEDGAVRRIDLPRSSIAMFQIVEYLRAFLFGRVGLDAMNGILILSGAFSLFRKASVVEAGGTGRRTSPRTWN